MGATTRTRLNIGLRAADDRLMRCAPGRRCDRHASPRRTVLGRLRRCRDEDGAALVEAALIIPILIIIVYGIVELGFLFDSAAVTTSSTRTGARLAAATYGAATDGAGRTAALADVQAAVADELGGLRPAASPKELWVYEADDDGLPESTGSFDACTDRCIRYTWDESAGAFALTGGNGWTNPNPCGTPDDLGIYVVVQHDFFSGVFGASRTVSEHTAMRIEPRGGC